METRRQSLARRHALLAIVVVGLLASACTATGSVGGFAAASPGAVVGPAGRPQAGAPREGSDKSGGNAGGPTTGRDGDPAAPRDDVLVIKTGTMTVEVKDLSVLVKARTAILGIGGYVSGSQQSSGDEHKLASVTYRIPAERWDEALDALKALGTKLVGEQTRAVEVTGQVRDLGARIANLKASERALQAIMSRATKITDVLEVQARLTDVRGQIEQLETEKAHLEEQAAYGTLTVTWDVPVVPVQEVSQNWSLGAEVDRAFAQLLGLGQGAATVAVWFTIVILPMLLIAAFAIGDVAFVARRFGFRPRSIPPMEGSRPTA